MEMQISEQRAYEMRRRHVKKSHGDPKRCVRAPAAMPSALALAPCTHSAVRGPLADASTLPREGSADSA
eukprot:3240987-Pleurochrysis_carterae.AAC.1